MWFMMLSAENGSNISFHGQCNLSINTFIWVTCLFVYCVDKNIIYTFKIFVIIGCENGIRRFKFITTDDRGIAKDL